MTFLAAWQFLLVFILSLDILEQKPREPNSRKKSFFSHYRRAMKEFEQVLDK